MEEENKAVKERVLKNGNRIFADMAWRTVMLSKIKRVIDEQGYVSFNDILQVCEQDAYNSNNKKMLLRKRMKTLNKLNYLKKLKKEKGVQFFVFGSRAQKYLNDYGDFHSGPPLKKVQPKPQPPRIIKTYESEKIKQIPIGEFN